MSVEIEEIWSPDLEEALEEALVIFPNPKGRHMLANGKFYGKQRREKGHFLLTCLLGRNKMISYYIFKKCGKMRSNKQISSHLQVLKGRQTKNMPSIHSEVHSHFFLLKTPYFQLVFPNYDALYSTVLSNFPLISMNGTVKIGKNEIELENQVDFTDSK